MAGRRRGAVERAGELQRACSGGAQAEGSRVRGSTGAVRQRQACGASSAFVVLCRVCQVKMTLMRAVHAANPGLSGSASVPSRHLPQAVA